MAGKIRPPAIAAILSLVSACKVSPTKSATAATLRSEIRRPYQRYLGEHEEWRIIGDNVGRDGEVGPVDVLKLREPYGLVEQRPLTVVERVGESERVPSVSQKEQRGKTLGKEQQRDCGK